MAYNSGRFSTEQNIPSQLLDDSSTEVGDEGQKYNPKVMSYIRDEWIKKQMKSRENDFTEYQNLKIFIGTWNVNGKKPSESLTEWLCADSPDRVANNDMYFVCFQEMVDLNATNVMVDSGAVKRGQVWEDLITQTLNEKEDGKYKLLISKHLVGILLCIYARRDVVPVVQDMVGNTAATGILGMMGNKGGAAARFRFFDSTICFVAAHLAAHRGNVQGRNSDFHTIIEKMDFKNEDGLNLAEGSLGIMEHDFVIWAGDLNYRIRSDIPDETVFDKCEAGEIPWLAEKDQLNITRSQGLAFADFIEAPLTFFPTYKYQAGTHNYDRRAEKKVRSPAWCDRVLWRTSGNAEKSHVTLTHYGRSELRSSDHKPVQAALTLAIRKTIQPKKKAIYQEIMRKLDSWENTNIPKCALNIQGVEFLNAKYMIPQSKTIRMENQGSVPAQFRFVPKLEDKLFCKRWLSVSPFYGMVLPGESIEIQISIKIGSEESYELDVGKDKLEDILIMRIENGRDYFITVTGTFSRSCFASTIDELIRTPGPVRTSPPAKISDPVCLNLPKEIWRLVDVLFRRGMDTTGLFGDPGAADEIYAIREALDNGTPISDDFNVHSVAQALMGLLENLREPLVPQELFPRVHPLDETRLPSWCSNLLEQLPMPRHNVLVYIVCFLRELLKHSANELNVEVLAELFGKIVMRPEMAAYEDKFRGRTSGRGNIPYVHNAATVLMYLLCSEALA